MIAVHFFFAQRKVRTPSGSMPRRTRGRARRKPGATDSVTENKLPRFGGVRVKWRGKSPPPGTQVPGHDKPHAVQDRTGSQWRLARFASAKQLPGISRTLLCEVRGASRERHERNDHRIRGMPRKNRIRLTAAGANRGALREGSASPFSDGLVGSGGARVFWRAPRRRCQGFREGHRVVGARFLEGHRALGARALMKRTAEQGLPSKNPS